MSDSNNDSSSGSGPIRTLFSSAERQLLGLATIAADGSLLQSNDEFRDILEVESDVFTLHPRLRIDSEGSLVVAGHAHPFTFRWLSREANGAGVLALTQDVNSMAEARVEQSIETFESLVDASPVGIAVLDAEQNVIVWNKAAELIFGWTASEILGKRYPLVPEEQKVQFEVLYAKVMAGDGYRDLFAERQRKDGSLVSLSMSTTPVRDSKGKVFAALALLRDITREKTLEERLATRARMEAIGQLASGVAHDFNNILTVVTAHTAFIRRRGALEKDDRESFDMISRCVDQATDLTSQLLAYGRKRIIRPELLSLNDVVEETVGIVAKSLPEEISIEISLTENLPACRADRTSVGQLLLNLVTNARDALEGQGLLKIRTYVADESDGWMVYLEVEDDGVGIDRKDINRIFEPFYTTKDPGEGTGLGLATSIGIAEQAGGRLEVESERGSGSVFRLALPANNGVPQPRRADSDPLVGSGGLHVLLVDDDVSVREALCALIEALGHDVTPCESGEQALETLRTSKEKIDVVLSDVLMPKMGGGQLARRIAQEHEGVAVLLMSGNVTDPMVRRSIERGDVQLLQKPVEPEVLEATLQKVANSRQLPIVED